jgi:hypothetical protein
LNGHLDREPRGATVGLKYAIYGKIRHGGLMPLTQQHDDQKEVSAGNARERGPRGLRMCRTKQSLEICLINLATVRAVHEAASRLHGKLASDVRLERLK